MAVSKDVPLWQQPVPESAEDAAQMEHHRRVRLTLDPVAPAQAQQMIMEPMRRQTLRFYVIFVILFGLVITELVTWVYQMWWGLGVTGLTRPTMWAVYIVNFVYFIGIGHAGTFISAALRALKVEYRRPISRAAEIVTVFALATAATFPIIHLGRSWKFYWLLPYPNQRQIWPSYHSPLLWDLTAILTYLSCSILFAYIAMLPDLAMLRDRSIGGWKLFYRILALGWRGSEQEWHNQETALNVFTYAIIPVMFSVHTIVSWDFAMALQPGWHSTVFGPYFVIGALFSGAGAVILALILLKKTLHLDYFLRDEHFNGMGIFLLLLSMTWAYFYFNDYLAPWYGKAPADVVLFNQLSHGYAAPFWYTMLIANIVIPWATLWSRKIRTNLGAMFFIALMVNVGMYIERVIIIPISLGVNELPYDWGRYHLRLPETLITIGAFSLVGFLYVLFTRFFPIIPYWEVFEGQIIHKVQRIGKALIPARSEPD